MEHGRRTQRWRNRVQPVTRPPMAKVEFDSSITRIRGKIGRMVYREQHGQTVIVAHRSRADRPSAAQTDRRQRFRDAQAYAAAVLADPLKRECYRKLAAERKCPPNALLIANFLNPPAIEQVDLTAYQGRAGDIIRVLATDAIEVVNVTLTVRGAGDAVLEAGSAVKDHDLWVYGCTATASEDAPVTIEITAQNRAGTKATATFPAA